MTNVIRWRFSTVAVVDVHPSRKATMPHAQRGAWSSPYPGVLVRYMRPCGWRPCQYCCVSMTSIWTSVDTHVYGHYTDTYQTSGEFSRHIIAGKTPGLLYSILLQYDLFNHYHSRNAILKPKYIDLYQLFFYCDLPITPKVLNGD